MQSFDVPLLLTEWGNLFQNFLASPRADADVSKNWDLHLLFFFLWQMEKRPEKETVLIHWEGETNFILSVCEKKILSLVQVEKKDLPNHKITSTIHLSLKNLAKAASQSQSHLIFALLKGEGILWDGKKIKCSKSFQRLRISWDSMLQILQWILPFSGIGLIFFSQQMAIPCIVKAQKFMEVIPHPIEAIEAATHSPVLFTQEFRQKHNLTFAIAFDLEYLGKILREEITLSESIMDYAKNWFMSFPLEINDFIPLSSFVARFFPIQESFKKCNWNKENFSNLWNIYFGNAWKYLKLSPIYFHLKSPDQNLFLEITHEGIYEIPQKPEDGNIFVFDMEFIIPLLGWISNDSLHLFFHFLQGIIPAEILEQIHRKDILVSLTLRDEKNKEFCLLVSAGQHELPGTWQGDCFIGLFPQSQLHMISSECLPQVPVIIAEQKKEIHVHFPTASLLLGKSLKFELENQAKQAYGIAQLISETSLLATIAPGMRISIKSGKMQGDFPLVLQEKNYQVISGRLLYTEMEGKLIKHPGFFERHCFHHFLFPIESGLGVSHVPDFSNSLPAWWQEATKSICQSTLLLEQNQAQEHLPSAFELPQSMEEGKIQVAHFGFKKASIQFSILKAWAVPLDKRGNFLIRVRTLAKKNKQKGFGLLEFPCYLPGILDRIHPIPVSIQKTKNGLLFYVGETLIWEIRGSYLQLKPGWLWAW